ncbi:MAG: hypothetical protein QHJ73_11610 [Armatimonadota bacterium]|nr:hypothetical protein [Armatimonadota bacterium]
MSRRIRIGWAERDITPTRPVALRGQFNLRIATRVQDPLTLTALALEGEGEGVILVSVDLVAVDASVLEEARQLLETRLPGFDPRRFVASATHTHTAPFAGTRGSLQDDQEYLDAIRARYPDYMDRLEYTRLLVEAMVSAACEAWEKRREGSLGWGYSYAVVGENRRVRYFDGRAVMYGKTSEPDFSHIEGHVDHGVNLLFTYNPAGALTGVLVNIACPAQASEGGQDYVSADYWHDVRQELRRRFAADLHVLPQCSAAGDQTPHRLIATRAEERMLRLKYGEGLSRASNLALRADIARRVGYAVAEAEPVVRKDLRQEVVLKHVHRNLDLPHWDVTEKEYHALQEEISRLTAQLQQLGEVDPLSNAYTALRSRIAWCQRAVERYHHPPQSVPVEVNIIRVGDIAFVTVPFEYYLDFGDRIKGRSPALQTFVVQLAGGGSYLPTERAAAGLSYGAIPASCRVSPAGGQVIVDEAIATLQHLFEA